MKVVLKFVLFFQLSINIFLNYRKCTKIYDKCTQGLLFLHNQSKLHLNILLIKVFECCCFFLRLCQVFAHVATVLYFIHTILSAIRWKRF